MSTTNNNNNDATHGPVPDNLECLVTMEDIDETNYVEYQSAPSGIWKAALMEQGVVEQLLKTQFHNYISKVKASDCQAELRRLLTAGPPIYVSDKHGLPLAKEDDTHVSALWYASTNTTVSAQLDGAVTGQARTDLWEELQEFLIEEGKEEGDDDDTSTKPASTATNTPTTDESSSS